MENHPDAKLLRIFIGESDSLGHKPLYEVIVFEASRQGLSGATVTRGIMGYGPNNRVHTTKLLEISSDMPLIIEIIDTEEKVRPFVETVSQLFEKSNTGGLITIEKAEVLFYKPSTRS